MIRAMRDPLVPFVLHRGAAVLDGGLATELARNGFDLSGPLWSARALVTAPDRIAAVHRDYLRAGAEVITTATYQATIPGLVAYGLNDAQAQETLVSGVAMARRERDAFWAEHRGSDAALRPLVAASIGSFGAFLADGSEYRGAYDLSVDALADWHRPRVRLLETTGADLLAFETIPALPEAEAIVRILAERDGPPAWLSLQARDAHHVADGAPVATAARLADASPRIIAVGVNCVAPDLVGPLLGALSAGTAKPLVAYPNAGGRWDPAVRAWTPGEERRAWETWVPAWRHLRARLIGGCCRTTPDDIRAVAAALR